MAMSVQIKRAYAVAEKYDEGLKATDVRLRNCVRVIHEEGTIYFFESAFLMRWKDPEAVRPPPLGEFIPLVDAERYGEWLLVFTEHQGFHVFSFDELYCYDQYTRSHMAPEVLEEQADG